MKYILLICLVFIFSCNQSDNNDTAPQVVLKGKYLLTDSTYIYSDTYPPTSTNSTSFTINKTVNVYSYLDSNFYIIGVDTFRYSNSMNGYLLIGARGILWADFHRLRFSGDSIYLSHTAIMQTSQLDAILSGLKTN